MNQNEKKELKENNRPKELSPEDLEKATGGASYIHTDKNNKTITYHCTNSNVTDELLKYSLDWSKACHYAGLDTQSCYKCWCFSMTIDDSAQD